MPPFKSKTNFLIKFMGNLFKLMSNSLGRVFNGFFGCNKKSIG